jgi:hypothetical protein
MENNTNPQARYATQNTFVKIFFHKDLIGDWNFTGWRLYVSKEREIEALPFSEQLKTYLKVMLRKAKYGIAIDESGLATPIVKMEQIVEAKILPPWTVCSFKYLQANSWND